MNKLLTKIVGAALGLSMTVGVGVAVAVNSNSGAQKAEAASGDSYAFSQVAPDGVLSTDGNWSYKTGKNGGTDPAWNEANSELRIYVNGWIEFTGSSGVTLTSASFTMKSNQGGSGSNKAYPTGWSTDNGTISSYSRTATTATVSNINASSFKITIAGSKGNVGFKTVTMSYTTGGAPTTYTVTYDANGGTGTMTDPDSPYESGDTVTTLTNTFTRTDYNFVEWNTVADGSGTSYDEGDTFKISSNTTLYAQWEMDASSTYTDDTVKKTITWNLATASYVQSSSTKVTWTSNRFSVVADKAGAGTATNNYLPPSQSSSRLYKDSTVTFTPLGTDDILKIEATATSDSYATALAGSTWTNSATAAVSQSNSKHVVITAGAKGAIQGTISGTCGLTEIVVHYGTFVVRTLSSIELSKDDSLVRKTYSAGEAPSFSGLTVTAVYDNSDREDVTSEASITADIATVSLSTVSISYQATYSGKTSNTVTVSGITVTRANPIRAIYDKSSGTSVDVYGYYVGFLKGTGPVIMDGAFGIVIYAKDHDVSDYEEGATILHVTGSVSIYNGLYEIGSASISEASGTYEAPDIPEVYSIKGGETKYEQNRLTHVSGVVTVESGSLTGNPGDADVTLVFTKNASSVTVFLKKAAQTTENMSDLNDAVTSGDEITIKCFTGWYNAFQVQFVSINEIHTDYTAEQFAQQLLDDTDDVCSDWDGVTNNKTALVSVWNTLSDDDHYQALLPAQKQRFATATANYDNDSLNALENAAGRYNMLVKKYGLANFASRTDTDEAPVVPLESNISLRALASNNTAAIISIIAVLSLSAVAGYFMLRKRKEQ